MAQTTIGELRSKGTQALADGRVETALRVFAHLLDISADDVEARLKLADALRRIDGADDAAHAVYRSTAEQALHAGHPLIAALVAKVLDAAGADAQPIYEQLSGLYGAESGRTSWRGERTASPDEAEREVTAPDVEGEVSAGELVAAAAAAGNDLSRLSASPVTLPRLPLLSDLPPPSFEALIESMHVHRLPDGAAVVSEGEIGASFFFVAAGEVRVFRSDAQEGDIEIARLHRGSLFGEMALIQAAPRTASVTVVGGADLLEVTKEGLSSLATEMAPIARAMDKFTRERLLNNLLATAPLFRGFSRAQRIDLVRRFTGHEVSTGTVIISEGDAGRGLYLILSGAVDVTKQQGTDEVMLATLTAGEVFGEIALIHGGPATATVKAAQRSSILFLDKVYFQRLVTTMPELKRYFDELIEARITDTELIMADQRDDEIAKQDEMVLI